MERYKFLFISNNVRILFDDSKSSSKSFKGNLAAKHRLHCMCMTQSLEAEQLRTLIGKRLLRRETKQCVFAKKRERERVGGGRREEESK